MLLNKPLQPNDVVSVKISNGDELIAKYVETNNTHVVVSKPMLMVLGQSASGQPGVQMMPFFMLGAEKDGNYPINKDHVVCMVPSNGDAKAGYTQATTGLTIPKTGLSGSLVTE